MHVQYFLACQRGRFQTSLMLSNVEDRHACNKSALVWNFSFRNAFFVNQDLLHNDLTGKIIGASFEVHKFLGNGFQEVICQRALAYEMRKLGVKFKREIK